MAWTPIAKPTSSVWTSTNAQGKEQYDQASLTYDSSTTFYDGYNPSQWTDVAKPSYQSTTITTGTTAGMATGLVMPPTYAVTSIVTTTSILSGWHKISKPT